MTASKKRINLDEWYTNNQAVERLSANAGRPIDRNYPRTLARYGKVETLDIGTGSKLYRKRDIDTYIVSTTRGRKAATQAKEVSESKKRQRASEGVALRSREGRNANIYR